MRVSQKLVAINNVIEALERVGFTCLMVHRHNIEDLSLNGNPIEDFTAFSIGLLSLNGELMEEYLGFAFCSVEDQFCPLKGAQMAFSRAMQQFTNYYGRDMVKRILKSDDK